MENMDVMNINTLGDLIKFHREKKEFSIDELSRKTKIRMQQLVNLEENKLNELPNRVYLVGFLKTLCNELEMNLDIALEFLNECNLKEGVLEFLPLGKEIKARQFKSFEKPSNKKMLLAAILLCGFAIVASVGVSIYNDAVSQLMKEKVIPKVVVPEVIVLGKEQAMATLPAIAPIEEKIVPVMQQLTITAKTGTAFLAYRVDQNQLVKIFLQRGKVLELKGEQIRLDVGNADALEFSQNGKPLTIDNSARSSTVHLVFPEVPVKD